MIKKLLTISIVTAALSVAGLGGSSASAATFTVNPGDSIQTAIDGAAAGDTISIAAGTYTEAVNVNKSVIIQGAQAGNDARGRSGAETTINFPAGLGYGQANAFAVTAPNVTIDGLTMNGGDDTYSAGIFADNTDVTGLRVVNNVMTDNQNALWITRSNSTNLVVSQNVFADNNIGGSNNSIFIANPGSSGSNLRITNNTFRNTDDGSTGTTSAIQINSTVDTQILSNIRIAGNDSTNDGMFVILKNVDDVVIDNNTSKNQKVNDINIRDNVKNLAITNNTLKDGAIGVYFIGIAGTTDKISLTGNTITGMSEAGVRTLDREFAVADGVILRENTLTGNAIGVDNQSTFAIDANNNWWGCVDGPGASGCDSLNGVVLASTWYTNAAMTATNADGAEAAPGVPNTAFVKTINFAIISLLAVAGVVIGSILVRRYAKQV